MLKPIKTRFVRINIPPFDAWNKNAKEYKMEFFACNPSNFEVTKGLLPVGIESLLVQDSQFSASSILGIQYKAHFGRLNTEVDGGAWCASSCSPREYLQIDLGNVWEIREIENQGRYTTNGDVVAVKTFFLSSRLGDAFWTPYTINGATKIFWGNNIANIATRHKLLKPITASQVRFEPRTCIKNACMRVELYGTKTNDLQNRGDAVVFGRSMLLIKSTDKIFLCNSDVARFKAHCHASKDQGKTWQPISLQILNVLAFDSSEQRLYGLSTNGKNYMKSRDPDGFKWNGISNKQWYSLRDGAALITAVEIPFVPISRNVSDVIEPLVQMTSHNGSKWLADQVGVYYRTDGLTTMVISFVPYSFDLSPNPCHTGVCLNGYCELLGGAQFKCHCMPGYSGLYCDTVINHCVSSPCANHGTCSPLVNAFKCTCALNYYGVTCQEFDECSSSPCQYEGTCTHGSSSYTCACLPGFSGINCQVTPCMQSPCVNQGTCTIVSGGLSCLCVAEYAGRYCQYDQFTVTRGSYAVAPESWNYDSGKFDKLFFVANESMTIFGVCVPDTFKTDSSAQLTVKVGNLDGSSTSLTRINHFNTGNAALGLRCTTTSIQVFLWWSSPGSAENLVHTMELASKAPFFQGSAVSCHTLVQHKSGSANVAESIEVSWVLPPGISYKSRQSQPSEQIIKSSPSQMSIMKFGSLKSPGNINIYINVTVDPKATCRDNQFHHATISTSLKYRWQNPCGEQLTSVKTCFFTFFCPECNGFGPLGMKNGQIKDSQIQASTAQRYGPNSNAWVPMTSFRLLNVVRGMKLNFLQVDLKTSRDINMVVIEGIPKDDVIPLNVIRLSFSENLWKWKEHPKMQITESSPGSGDSDVTVSIAILKPIKSRYVRINFPPYGIANENQSVYKVEIYTCKSKSKDMKEGLTPVGIESPKLVPDSQFSASSILGLQYKAHFGRLNTKVDGGAWCASVCSPMEYLQVDLAVMWKISEIENQGRYTTTGIVIAVKSYSLSFSFDGASWTPYQINGGLKIFWGNDIANLATRHKLLYSITAKYIRFEPRTCIQNACMRVEVYGTKVAALKNKPFPVVFGRSMLLKKSMDEMFMCNAEVTKDKPHCYISKDKGKTWRPISLQILNVLAFDSSEQRLYGLSTNGKNYMKSRDPDGLKWNGISNKQWYSLRDGAALITAVEIPFVPISRNVTDVIEPLVQMTSHNGGKWLADQVGVYYKPTNGDVKMVLSFLPYSSDLSSNPCHAGVCTKGRCEHLGGSRFICHCMPGYSGPSCDTEIDYCGQLPCQNGGTCTPLKRYFSCACPMGYSGQICEDYDDCTSSPCLNGGNCTDGSNSYTCTCPPNYSGTRCEEFDECSSSPCQNGGTCTDGSSSYTCACINGFSGMNCQVTPCTISPCLNGGTCNVIVTSSGTSYSCKCTTQYSGLHCQIGGFVLGRGTFSLSEPWSYSSGKYDKIVFSSNQNLTLDGACIADTFSTDEFTTCSFDSKIREKGSTTVLTSMSFTNKPCYRMAVNKVQCFPFLTNIILTPGTRYIIELKMSSAAAFRKVVSATGYTYKKTFDSSYSVSYAFNTVGSVELADSNGSTETEGGIKGLLVHFTHD